jgi:hypothetical protein
MLVLSYAFNNLMTQINFFIHKNMNAYKHYFWDEQNHWKLDHQYYETHGFSSPRLWQVNFNLMSQKQSRITENMGGKIPSQFHE